MNEQEVIKLFKSGLTQNQIARKFHVQNFVIQQILKGYPTSKIVAKINSTEGFEEWFKNLYLSTDDMSYIKNECLKHPFFSKIRKASIYNRISEIRKYFDLPLKMPERTYNTSYDRIKGYIIRNSKYMAKRRGIYFNLKPSDFELPERCPILGYKLEYGTGNDGNSPRHATLDRIDNTKGYIPGNVMIISRLANAMKNEASFTELNNFITNYSLLLNNIDKQGIRGSITDIFPNWKKLSLDS